LLVFIFSFVDFYSADVSSSGSCPPGTSAILSRAEDAAPTASAWHGFFGWFGVLVAVVAAILIAMDLLAPQVKLPVPTRLAALGAWAVALLCEIIALFVTPGGSGAGEVVNPVTSGPFASCRVSGDVGHGFGYWITLILCIVGLVLTLMRFQQTGGQLPGALGNMPNIGGHGPQGGMGGGARPGPGPGPNPPPPGANPPPPGYGPPQ
jgi:hypothetical protein